MKNQQFEEEVGRQLDAAQKELNDARAYLADREGAVPETTDRVTLKMQQVAEAKARLLAAERCLAMLYGDVVDDKAPAPIAASSPVPDEAPPLDYSALATREQLIAAFGAFTGMSMTWFDNLKDTPALLKARKVHGVGTRGSTIEPRFCPWEVMAWLASAKRKKGRQFHSADKPWELLEKHFPAAYAKHSRDDPRE